MNHGRHRLRSVKAALAARDAAMVTLAMLGHQPEVHTAGLMASKRKWIHPKSAWWIGCKRCGNGRQARPGFVPMDAEDLLKHAPEVLLNQCRGHLTFKRDGEGHFEEE